MSEETKTQGLLDGESDFERRIYNAKHRLADDAEGSILEGDGEGLFEEPPAKTETEDEGEDGAVEIPAAPHAQAPRRTRVRPSAAARAWLERQETERRRKSLTILHPREAIEVYREVLRGGPGHSDRPEPLGERPDMEGSPIAVQVWAFVRATRGYEFWRLGEMNPALRDLIGPLSDAGKEAERRSFLPTEEFEARIAKWPLPRTFHAPVPAMCGAEIEEMTNGRGEIERALEREERGDPEGRLGLGLRKEE